MQDSPNSSQLFSLYCARCGTYIGKTDNQFMDMYCNNCMFTFAHQRYEEGDINGYSRGYDEGYDIGYNEGIDEKQEELNSQ